MNQLPESYLKKCRSLSEFKDNPPSLEELYQLVKTIPKYKDITDLNLLSKFRIGISNLCCNSYLQSQSLYDLWFLFYIKEKYGKEWFEQRNQFL